MNLPVSTAVISGESLLGYVARAADRNGHPRMQHLLGLAGIDLYRADFLCSHPIPDALRAARFFGCSAADIEVWRRTNLAIEGTTAKFVNFFGSPVRTHYCERELRRISPRSLQISPHHRAAWILRPLKFCRESGENLISVCPNPSCSKSLKWHYAFGIGCCESCLDEESEPTTDLREFPTATLDPELVAPYKFIAGLVDPDPGVRDACRLQIPPALSHLPNWQIFEFAVTIAGIHVRRATKRQGGETIVAAFDRPEWTRSLVFVGDVLLRWPASVADLVAAMRADAPSRKGHFGIYKELGPLAKFGRREGLLPNLVEELKGAVLDSYKAAGRDDTRSSYELGGTPSEYIRYTDALEKYSLDGTKMTRLFDGEHSVRIIRAPGAGRAPFYIKERDLQDVLATAKALVRISQFQDRIGFPTMISSALADSGHIRAESGPAARLRGYGNLWVHSTEMVDFQHRVQNAARPPQSGDVPFKDAVRKCDIRARQILPLLRDCLDGRVEFSLAGPRFDLAQLQFNLKSLRDWSAKTAWQSLPEKLPEVLTGPDAAILLGISPSHVVKLLDAGVLSAAPYGTARKVRGQSVEAFDRKFVNSNRAAEIFGVCAIQIFEFLTGFGLSPAKTIPKHKVILWSREDFDRLKQRIQRNRPN